MRKHVVHVCVLSMLALSAAVAGCDRATEMTAPDALAAQFAARDDASSRSRGRAHSGVTAVGWTTVAQGHATETFSSGGGSLEMTDGESGPVIIGLRVPGGSAPGGPVTFAMQLVCAEEHCVIDLQAERNGTAVRAFRKPVQLYVNTAYLDPGIERSTLKLAQVSEDGELLETVVSSHVTGDGFLRASLKHFSLYAPFAGYLPISD